MCVSLVIVQCHKQDRVPFAVRSLVFVPVDKVHHIQPLQAQLKEKSKLIA